MNPYPPSRPSRAATAALRAAHAPHAALLIDFDNVTLGIRSDLTKELRTLLDSDIIKGKVAVQRAYADWRRYPQYIVPLSESSIDLIFAPAFGTNKKNATDIRLAVDAIELVFTRPEIGTFILLSGDSDFSSLVIKLKEYGKYVIGVGIRESASDLLIQNCDEYYSYSDLAGLTREADLPSVQRDPWELVVEAVGRMQRDDDVMRSDRLKQVMQQIDSNFDEKNAGFNRFSKFVTEAGTRGLIGVTKLDNGQFEVRPGGGDARPRGATPKAGAEKAQPAAAPAGAAAAEENGRRTRRGRRGGRGGREKEPAAAARERKEARPGAELTLAEAFQLIQRALAELPAPVTHDKLRARMVALLGREDALLDAGRFTRLLRQANDAEVADVRKVGDEDYEVSPHRVQRATMREEQARTEREAPAERATAVSAAAAAPNEKKAAPAAPASEPKPAPSPAGPRAVRFRRGSRGGPLRPSEVPLIGAVKVEESPAPPEQATAPKQKRAAGGRRKTAKKKAAGASPARRPKAKKEPATE